MVLLSSTLGEIRIGKTQLSVATDLTYFNKESLQLFIARK